MFDSKLVKKTINRVLKERGFTNKATSWYSESEEMILVANLQKSRYGEQYFVNCAAAFKSLGVCGFPKEHKCHVRIRLTSIASEGQRDEVSSIFDLEDQTVSDTDREGKIVEAIENIALPFLKECSNEAAIIDAVKSGKLKKAFVHKYVRDMV